MFSVENPYQDEDILNSLNISYIDDKIDLHLPYESSGDIKKDQKEQNIGIIIEDEMKTNSSQTDEDISAWPDSFPDISIEETTNAISRNCFKITALALSTHCEIISAVASISIDMINEDIVNDFSGSGDESLDSSGSIAITTEGELT